MDYIGEISALATAFCWSITSYAFTNASRRIGALQVNIFSDELLEQWINVKGEEVLSIGTMPHPFEYKMYFNL